MLAKPEWNPDRYDGPKRSAVDYHNMTNRLLMAMTLAGGTTLVLVGLTAFF